MKKDSYTETKSTKLSACAKQWVALVLVIMIGILISNTVNAQDVYHKQKARHYKSKFRSQINDYSQACNILEKKKYQKPKSSPHFSSNKKEPVKPVVVTKAEETSNAGEVKKLHDHDDKVLKANILPSPTSMQRGIIREMVAQNLSEKNDNDPIELAPLYFRLDEHGFSVTDMNPFLIAVEFALQGKTIVIEGHDDGIGIDNVKLSAACVQKIKQLMHDMGVPDDRISVVSHGDGGTESDNDSASNKQLNRRVDFKAI
jgi:outer membrane protein OmpA-like peptidoglycan-associated protein